jgi:sugar lactone lactonase YvrE
MKPSLVTDWTVDRILHFEAGAFLKEGVSHFGFRDRAGRLLALDHQRHLFALVSPGGEVEWTAGAEPFHDGAPHITVDLSFPIYADVLPDGAVLVSNFGDARLWRLDPAGSTATLVVDGHALGMADAGNCLVDPDGYVWLNEVTGCRVWRFDPSWRPVLTLGDGNPGFAAGRVAFDDARFSWIYDIRLAPDGRVLVLDSRNFALRAIAPEEWSVETLATGFGSDPDARFDGPISLAVDETGTAYVGDRWNHVVRIVDPGGNVRTIPDLTLPAIASMDYHAGELFVPTDLDDGSGDLVVLRRA